MRVIPMTRIRESKNFIRFEEHDSALVAGRSLYVDKTFCNEVGPTSVTAVVVCTNAELDLLLKSLPPEPPASEPVKETKKKR